MSLESIKATVRDFVEGAWNYEKLVAMEHSLTPDYIMHGRTGDLAGPRAYRDAVSSELEAMDYMYVKVDDMLAEGDRVLVRYTTTFDLHGEFMGAIGKGQTITMRGMSLHRVGEDGRIAESWDNYDLRCLMHDLGAEQNLTDEDRDAIRGVIDQALKIGLRDTHAHCALYYAEGAEVVASHGELMKGRHAINAWLDRFPPITDWNLKDIEIDGAGEVAYVRGTYTMLLSPKAKVPFDKGKYLEVWRKQADGSWKVIRHIFSSEVASRRQARPQVATVLAHA